MILKSPLRNIQSLLIGLVIFLACLAILHKFAYFQTYCLSKLEFVLCISNYARGLRLNAFLSVFLFLYHCYSWSLLIDRQDTNYRKPKPYQNLLVTQVRAVGRSENPGGGEVVNCWA